MTPRLPKHLPSEVINVVEDHAEYYHFSCTGSDLSGKIATDVIFDQVLLRHVTFTGTRFLKLRMADARLEDCECSGAAWEKARFRRVELAGCRLQGANLIEAVLENVVWKDCSAENTALLSAQFRSARFERCSLREALFTGADLSGVVFRECDLTKADLRGAKLDRADFRGSTIAGLQVGLQELHGAIFDPRQALQVAGLLGIRIREIDEELFNKEDG